MARFLSEEWIAEMDRAAASVSGPRSAEGTVVIQHVVTHLPSDLAGDDERAYHLVISPTSAGVIAGRASEPTVTFTAAYDTAAAVASGSRSAQAAFMAGELLLVGEVHQLLAHHGSLATTGDVFAEVREGTEF